MLSDAWKSIAFDGDLSTVPPIRKQTCCSDGNSPGPNSPLIHLIAKLDCHPDRNNRTDTLAAHSLMRMPSSHWLFEHAEKIGDGNNTRPFQTVLIPECHKQSNDGWLTGDYRGNERNCRRLSNLAFGRNDTDAVERWYSPAGHNTVQLSMDCKCGRPSNL